MGAKTSDQKTLSGSPDRFGYEWAKYSTILPESREQLERWMGSTGLESSRGKTILDVGCGMGRNPYWMAKAGAAAVVAVDVDDQSVAAARDNLADLENVRVEKVSVYDLEPECIGTFDRVTCIGVLHHLEAPREALNRMWRCVAPGGELVLWCYGKEGNRLLLPIIHGFRQIGSRLPVRITHLIAKLTTTAIWPALHLIPWQTAYYRNLRTLSFGNVESIVFDQMLPRTSHYWSREEMDELIRVLGAHARFEFVQGNSWHICVSKPKDRTE